MKKTKINENGFGLIESLLIILIVLVIGFGGYFVYHSQKNSLSSTSTPSSKKSSNASAKQSDGEELNTKGTRRPPQYLHICSTDDDITYVSQGNPRCLEKDSYRGDYNPSVPGLLYSSPCKTTTGTERYVYISESEECPRNTKLVFYNNVCPTDATSSDQCAIPN